MTTLGAIRAGVGLLELSAPWVAVRTLGESMGPHARMAARVLGARQFLQVLISGSEPSRSVWALGAELDALHAASMVALSVAGSPSPAIGRGRRRRRRASGGRRNLGCPKDHTVVNGVRSSSAPCALSGPVGDRGGSEAGAGASARGVSIRNCNGEGGGHEAWTPCWKVEGR